MGFLDNFKRSKQNVEVEKRSEDENGYTVPVSLGLLRTNNRAATSLSAVFAAVELISNTVASIPIHAREKDTGKIVNHPITRIFENGILSRYMIVKQMVADMLLNGNGIAYIERGADGTPLKLIYVQHGQCDIEYNEQTRDLYYRIPSIRRGRIEPINVIHFYKNSTNGVQGKGIRAIAGDALNLALAADNAAKDFYESGCDMNAILKSTRPLTNEQKMQLKQDWMSAKTANNGRGNAIAVLGNDIEYQTIGTNASEAQLLDTRKFNISEICRYFNISPCLLGDMSGASQYGSLENAQLDFIIHCIMPIVHMIEAELNRKLFRPSENNIYIDFDENHVMLSDKASQANYFSTLVSNGIMSVNEARETIGLTPVEGGDKLIIPFTKVDDNIIGQTEE